MVFGLHDPQTLCNLTSFCGDFLKKESTAATQEDLKHNTEQAVTGTYQLILQKVVKKNSERGECSFSRRNRTFSASVLISLSWVSLKNKNNTMNGLQY